MKDIPVFLSDNSSVHNDYNTVCRWNLCHTDSNRYSRLRNYVHTFFRKEVLFHTSYFYHSSVFTSVSLELFLILSYSIIILWFYFFGYLYFYIIMIHQQIIYITTTIWHIHTFTLSNQCTYKI